MQCERWCSSACLSLFITLSFVGQFAIAQGPSSPYYLTDGGTPGPVLQVVQGGAIVDSWSINPYTSALAVTDTVKVYTNRPSSSIHGDGMEYTLAGTPTGVTYPWQPWPDEDLFESGTLLDGGTDGVAYNYAAEFEEYQRIWRYDLDWKTPVPLFSTPVNTIGITYDRSAGTLWISQDEGKIQQVTTTGDVLSEFDPGFGRWTALAWEPATDTLWAHSLLTDILRQWSKDGTLLQEVTVPGLSQNGITGGEFSMVPEPSSLVLSIFVLVGLRCSRCFSRWPSRSAR
jgi:hypothetical protein